MTSSQRTRHNGKIFCIGFNKTGTTSLHKAFLKLGFSSLHWAPEGMRNPARRIVARRITENIEYFKENDLPLLTLIDHFDAFSDITLLAKNYTLLDQQYPGSKFVLNTRASAEDWINSRKKHAERAIRRAEENGDPRPDWDIQEDRDREFWNRHHEQVQSYFSDRAEDLLWIDVPGGDGYEKICPFLGVEVPEEEFPQRNMSAKIKTA